MARSPQGSPPDPTARLVGRSPAIEALRAQIRHLAAFDTVGNPHVPTLLLQGETGIGKGLVARVMHDSGPRASRPFVDVNCAAIPDTLLEAELFGYEAGAFSEAKRAKPGFFEAASGGTLFLDEIDSLPLTLQSKLLTALEAKRVRRLGAVREQAVDVKLIAAAQADLGALVEAGRFRADLYHRLAVVVLTLPPLQARGEDVLVLAQAYLQRYAAAHRVRPKRLSPGAEAWLRGHSWRGNVRELSHLLERVTLLSAEPIVDAETLTRLSLRPGEPAALAAATPDTESDRPLDEAARIRQALQEVGGNVVQAAGLLGVSRGGLRYRMLRYGITPRTRGTGPSSRIPSPAPTPLPPCTRPGGPAPADAPVLAPVWEHKPVVVLAIDLAFPTTVDAEALPFEPWTAARHWEHAIVEKVRGFGGILLQRLSSLLVIAFGMPRTLEQLPERAVQAALAIRQLVIEAQSMAAREPVPEVRQAVHLGTMLVETQAGTLTERYQAEGETLSLAVRLLGHAGPGELLVSPQVGRLVAGWCELQARDLPSGVGQTPPMPTYAVAGLLPRHLPRAVLEARGLSQFVGRERELARLSELVAQVARGRGQVVGIVGEPGVGKSRLIYELTRAPQVHSWRVFESHALAYAKATPYRPVIELLKTHFQVENRDEAQAIRQKVIDRLSSHAEIRQQALPVFLGLLDVPVENPVWEALDPLQRRRRILDAVKGLLLCESHIQPVLLIVEDLQWVNGETQAILDSLVESLPAARLLVLASYRPEYQHGWGSKTYYTQLRLDPLPPERADELLQALLGNAAELQPVTHLLLERTEGNPFFLEESLQTLVEMQILAGEQGAYRLVKSPQSLQVPATVQAVLAARIDRLSPEEKHLLQTAAVIGTVVPFPLLQAVVELGAEAIGPALDHLQAAEFLYQARLFPEVTYTFKHALTHEVAYSSILAGQRRLLHGRIVGAIEQRAPDRLAETAELLAHHARLGEVWETAVKYCRQAGAKTAGCSAHREAVAYYEEALAALEHLPESHETIGQGIDIRLDLRYALQMLGEFGKILLYLREADTLAHTLGDQSRLGRISAYMANYYWVTSDYDRAIESGEHALAMADGDVAIEVRANLALGWAYHARGDYHRATEFFRRNLDALAGGQSREHLNTPDLPSMNINANINAWLVWCLAELGVFPEGLARGEEAVQLAEAVDDTEDVVAAYYGVGLLYLRRGELHKAIAILERGLSRCQGRNLPVWFSAIASALGYVYALSGRIHEALPLLEQAVEWGGSKGIMTGHALLITWLSETYLLAGRVGDAIRLAGQALELSRMRKERGNQAWTLRLLGKIYAQSDPSAVAQGETHYRQALTLAQELGMRPLLAHCQLGLGLLYGQSGQLEQAHMALSAALEGYRAMGMTFWFCQAEAALVRIEGRC